MNFILPIAFVVMPFMFLSPGMIHRGHHYAFFVISMIILSSWIYGGIKIRASNKAVTAFLVYLCAWAVFTFISSFFVSNKHETSKAFYFICSFTAGSIIYLSAANSEIKTSTFYAFICGAVVFQASLGVVQMFGIDPVYWMLSKVIKIKINGYEFKSVGTLGNQDFLLAYISISLPLFFRKKWWVFIFLFIPILLMTRVSTAVITMAVGVVVYFGNTAKRLTILSIICLLIGIVYIKFIDKVPLDNDRFNMWSTAFLQIDSDMKVLFGLGPGSRWGGRGPLHNEWLSMLHTYGLVGITITGWFIYEAIKNFTGDRNLMACIVAACVNCIGNPALQYAPTLVLILILFGFSQRKHGGISDVS